MPFWGSLKRATRTSAHSSALVCPLKGLLYSLFVIPVRLGDVGSGVPQLLPYSSTGPCAAAEEDSQSAASRWRLGSFDSLLPKRQTRAPAYG